jgi:SAM-dependent methyltransferase
LVEREFNKQAPHFEAAGLTLSNQQYLAWVIDNLTPERHWSVLDAAAGTGILSRALAPHVRRVCALEIAEGMIASGTQGLERSGIGNVLFVRGSASEMPFAEDTFDLVTSRFAVHHFEAPQTEVNEMVRVCREGGRVAIIDLVSPDEPGLAACYNELERLRDPSHTRALTRGELWGSMSGAGLQILHSAARDVPVEVERWLDLTSTEDGARRRILKLLADELGGASATGMRPFIEGQALMFRQQWTIIVGIKVMRGRV